MIIKELLPYNRYTIKSYCKSEIDPSYTALVITSFKCPTCGTELPPLGHDESVTCKCKLQMTLHGNALQCTKSSKEKKK